MVVNAPSKGARGKGEANRNGNRGNRGRGKPERDVLATKADLLAQLTRQAEEHTRILERERAALGLPGRAAANDQANRQAPQPNNARRRNTYHIYNDHGNKKVFDPRQIPGLGGNDAPPGPTAAADAGADLEETLNQTFPDSPNFFPGRVFAIPGTIPRPPNQPQQLRPDGPSIVVAPWRDEPGAPAPQQQQPPGVQPSLRPPRGGHPGSPHGAPGGVTGPPLGPGHGPSPRGGPTGPGMMPGGGKGVSSGGHNNNNINNLAEPPPVGEFSPPMAGGGGAPYGIRGGDGGGPFGPPPVDPQMAVRLEAEAKKEAYRRELEEQIRAKKQAKEAEQRRRREEDAMWEARAAASPQPWDPEARAARRGGGGEPLRDDFGRPVANLRQRGGGGVSPSGIGPPLGFMQSPMGPGPAPGPYPGPPGPAGRLTVEIPGGGAGVFPPGPPGPDGPIPISGMPPMPFPGGPLAPMPFPGGTVPYDSPPGGGGPVLSPGSIPPVSPGNRRFMAAMNDLIAGPSEEQRREKEMARQRLQMDLEQQIREKKERQARERAEQERQRAKEEAELQAYHAQISGQRQSNQQRAAPVSAVSPGPSSHAAQQKQQQRAASAGGAPVAPPPLPPRRQGRGRIIDASWLDAPKPSVLPPLSPPPQGPGMSPNGGQYVRRTNSGMPEDIRSEGGMLQPRLPGRHPSHDGSPNAMGGTVSTMLQQLQEEQSRIREDFARQAAAMERLTDDANRAMADRDEAWRELQRVRDMLAGAVHPSAGCGPEQDDTDSPVIIDTHLLPRSTNAIPDPLPAPVTSEVQRRGHHTDPGEHAAAQYSAMGGGGRDAIGLLLKGGGLGRLRLGDRVLSPVAEKGEGASGFSTGELEPMQGGAYKGMGLPMGPPRRSGIPLPPGMPSRLSQLARPRIHSVYGLGAERPPPSRYNSFFGLDVGKDNRSPGARVTAPQSARADGPLPALQSRRPPPLRSPPSPPILRGDILSSPPSKQAQATRGRPAAILSGRVRSGRPQGVAERPPRGPRVPSAATHETPKSPGAAAGVKLPPMPMSARGQASQRNSERVQSILQGGHEDRLLRGLAGSEDGSGDARGEGHGGVEYGTDELVAMAEAAGGQLRRVGMRVREPSLPGLSNVLTPRRAADFLAQSISGISVGGGVVMGTGNDHAADDNDASPSGRDKKAPSRAFNSDSMGMYRSLVAQNAYGGKALAPAHVSGPGGDLRSAGGARSEAYEVADGPYPSSGAVKGSDSGDGLGGDGGAAGSASDGGFSEEGAVQAASAVASRAASAGDAAAITRLSSGGGQREELPVQRPVRVNRRNSQQQQQRDNNGGAVAEVGGGRSSSGGSTGVARGDEEAMAPADSS